MSSVTHVHFSASESAREEKAQAAAALAPSSREPSPISNRHNLWEQSTPVLLLHRKLIVFETFLFLYYYCLVVPLQFTAFLFWRFYDAFSSCSKVKVLTSTCSRVCVSTCQAVSVQFSRFWMARGYVDNDLVKNRDFGPTISFAGSGMLWTYYLGVAHHIYETYDVSKITFLASSGGSFVVIPLVMGMDPYEWCRRDWPHCLAHFDSRPLGTFFDALSFYEDLWDSYLPADAHVRATGRLHLSITLFPSFQNKVVTNFPTRKELINCICASICLPILFLRTFPRTQYGLAIDGGFTSDQPCMDRYTITVSVFNEQVPLSSSS